MGIDDKIAGVPGIPPELSGAGKISGAPKGLPEVRGADFSRILEELMQTAGALDAKAAQPASEDPQEIKEAVAKAKESLDTAMSLSESLLDAYRRTLIADPSVAKGPRQS